MKISQISLLTLALLAALPLAAQDKPAKLTPEQQAMMQAWEAAAKPGEQHKQLAAMVGKWTTKQTMWMDPTAPPLTETGSATNTLVLGDRHIRQDFRSKWMGQPFEGVGFIGYDNVIGKYYSTWMDSGSTGIFVSHGDYDPATKTYTYLGEMADPASKGVKIPVRQVVRVVDNDHQVFEMFETRGGKEAKTMQIDYTRQK
ncbi:DUF1579 domain-containing protein [Lysobacter arenosi]|jgi:hypothetical protein|uniref:DUF1579 domain-containing protein n=1 Tax=Lysobacter arenosi TaxID=2795387 RepID=A0ABX7R7C5_9GAMM|nr:DUF1579 domain-containing protein [Lysobacter arenosi]QSX74032.1 DUF1579 domain-containing protein [Lysobacter arenosi]